MPPFSYNLERLRTLQRYATRRWVFATARHHTKAAMMFFAAAEICERRIRLLQA